MTGFDEVLSNRLSIMLNAMHTAFVGVVQSYDAVSNTCNVQPIVGKKSTNGEDITPPLVLNAPVIKHRYKVKEWATTTEQASPQNHTHSFSYSWSNDSGSSTGTTQPAGGHTHAIGVTESSVEFTLDIQAGDLVLCVCSEVSTDSISSKKMHMPQSKRRFDLTDAIVVGLL